MNYEKIYNQIIQKARFENRNKKQGIYYEAHHIIPKCLGGEGNSSDITHFNIILLTAKEHYIAHRLLCLIYPSDNKLRFALWAMINGLGKIKRYKPSARIYSILRESYILTPKSQETKLKMSASSKGKIFSDIHKQRISEAAKNRNPISEETRKKMSNKIYSAEYRNAISNRLKGHVHSEETLKKIGDGNRGKVLSEDTKLKMSNAKKGKLRGPYKVKVY